MKVRYTVPSDQSYVSYSGNGSTTVFSVPYVFFDSTDLSVTLVNNATAVETTQAITTNYTVSGGSAGTGPAAGSVTMATAPASGTTLVIQRNVPYTQEIDYSPNDGFPAEVNEEGLDRTTMLAQQANRRAQQSVRLPATFDPNGTPITLPMGPEPSRKVIGWDQAGTSLALYDQSDFVTQAVAGAYNSLTTSGDGTTVTFTLGNQPANAISLEVFLDGVRQRPTTDYVLSGANVTFTTAPASGTSNIFFRWGSVAETGSSAAAETSFAVTSLTALQSLSPPSSGAPVTVMTAYRETTGDGGDGLWTWETGDQSVKVALDTSKGVWAAPLSSPTGSAGAWKRVLSGYVSARWFGAKGDAVLDTGDNSWSGTEDSAAIRAAWLVARTIGMDVYIPRGNYIVGAQGLSLTGEVVSNTTWRGDGVSTLLVAKTAGQVATFPLINLGMAQIFADGVSTGSPTYYATSPISAGQNIMEISTTSGLTVGGYVQMIDKSNPLLDFDAGGLDGIGSANASNGQCAKIVAVDDGTGSVFTVVRGTYTSSTGAVELDLAAPANFNYGSSVTIAGLTGTGSVSSLNGTVNTNITNTSGPGLIRVAYTATSGLGTITITGGTLTWAGDSTPRVVFSPAAESSYAGTSTTPASLSTCLRRYQAVRENTVVRDMAFTYDRTAPPTPVQTLISLSRTMNVSVQNVKFDWDGRAILLTGTIGFEVDNCSFDGGSNNNYYIDFGDGGCYGRISNFTARHGRHFTQGTSAVNFTGPAHVQTTDGKALGFFFTAFGTHGMSRDVLFENCEAIGSVAATTGNGFQLRGTRVVARNCRAIGCDAGVTVGPHAQCILDGGEFINNRVAVQVGDALDFKVINYPLFQGSSEAHLNFSTYNYLANNAPFPGLDISARVLGERCVFNVVSGTYDNGTGAVSLTLAKPINFGVGSKITLNMTFGTGGHASIRGDHVTTGGVVGDTVITFTAASGFGASTITAGSLTYIREPADGDVKWRTPTPASPIVLAADTKFDIKCAYRAPVFNTFDEDGVTPATYPFPGEYAYGLGTRDADFSIPAALTATYLVDPTAGNVTATLPAAAVSEGLRVTIKNATTGTGNTVDVDVAGTETIDGSAAPYTVADLAVVTFACNNGNWWIV